MPKKPHGAYFSDVNKGSDGNSRYQYGDNITVNCAHGSFMSSSRTLSMTVLCQADGSWSSDPSSIQCIGEKQETYACLFSVYSDTHTLLQAVFVCIYLVIKSSEIAGPKVEQWLKAF